MSGGNQNNYSTFHTIKYCYSLRGETNCLYLHTLHNYFLNTLIKINQDFFFENLGDLGIIINL